jgi:hypothetical protein
MSAAKTPIAIIRNTLFRKQADSVRHYPPEKMKRMLRPIIFMFAWVFAASTAVAQDSTLTLSLHQHMINQLAAAALPHSQTRKYRGEVNLAITSQPWEVPVRYTVLAVEVLVQPSRIDFNARVRVQAQGVDYTSVARGILQPSVADGKLRLVASGLSLPLQIAPFGARIDLGTIPADDFLPAAYRTLEFDLATLALPIVLPDERVVNIRLTSARVELKPPFVLVHATLGL